jgi:hypothetical protein
MSLGTGLRSAVGAAIVASTTALLALLTAWLLSPIGPVGAADRNHRAAPGRPRR